MPNTELLTVVNGGIQTIVPEALLLPQVIYLDFDGELTSYHNHDLDIHIDDVAVEDSGLDRERVAAIVQLLNDEFAALNVVFVTERPSDAEFSTIYVGKTDSFDEYGAFLGLAETVDVGNKIKNDNAFVMLDATADDAAIVATISHEANHIVFGYDHGGKQLTRFGWNDSRVDAGEVINDIAFGDGSMHLGGIANNISIESGIMYVLDGGSANNTLLDRDGSLYVCNGGVANNTILLSSTCRMDIYGTANRTIIKRNGNACIYVFGLANDTIIDDFGGAMNIFPGANVFHTTVGWCDRMVVYGGIVSDTTVNGGGGIVVSSGGTTIKTVLNNSLLGYVAGGNIYVNSGAITSETTVNTYCDMYVSSGGIALQILENGGNVNIEKGATVTFVPHTVISQTITNGRIMTIHSGTTANNTTINAGGSMIVYSGGTACNTIFDGAAKLDLSSGGVHRGELQIVSGGVFAYQDSIIDFTLIDRSINDVCLINDIKKIHVSPTYTLTMAADQAKGKYRLAGNASGFHQDVALIIDGTADGGTFSWQDGKYNQITLNGKKYTLEHSNNELCLTVSAAVPSKLLVDFSIDQVKQIAYYDGDTGGQFTGSVLKVPYVATATVTIDKDTPNGVYSFTTFLENYDGARRDFQMQVTDGIPEFVSASHDIDFLLETTSEDGTTTTWRFEDYFLTDKADASMPIGIRYDENGTPAVGTFMIDGTRLEVQCNDRNAETVSNLKPCDANKDGYYINATYRCGNQYSFHIEPVDTDNDYIYDMYQVMVTEPMVSECYASQIELVSFKEAVSEIDFRIPTKLGYEFVISNKDMILYKIEDDLETKIGDLILEEGRKSAFALKQQMHCWIAVAANMLYRGGYLSENVTAQGCFETLSDYYFNGVSEMGSTQTVFDDLGLSSQYKKYSDVYQGLKNMTESKKGVEAVAFISFEKHAVTCVSVDLVSETSAYITYVDSDRGLDGIVEKKARLTRKWCFFNDETFFKYNWYIEYDREEKEIESFVTLLGNTKGEPTIDLQKYERCFISGKVSASQSSNVSTIGSITVVSESITDAVVEAEGILEVASGAVADTLNIHANAAASFQSGSKVSGKVLTYGGQISVAADVDVSEAEFEFSLAQLAAGNEVMLDSLQNARAASFTVTVSGAQATGRYLLADGAAGFDGNVTLCGATFGDDSVRAGFADGELGTLAVGETLEIANQLYTLSVEDGTLVLAIEWASLRVLSVTSDPDGYLTVQPVMVTAMFSEDIVRPEYSYDGEHWEEYVDGVTMSENGLVWFKGTDAAGNQSEAVAYEVYNIIHQYFVGGGDADGISLPESTARQLLELSNDSYQHCLSLEVATDRLNLYGLPSGSYSWRVRDVDDVEWSVGNDIMVEDRPAAQLLTATEDDHWDAFFVGVQSTWSANYQALHTELGMTAVLDGRNRIEDIYAGSDDASILLLTDDTHGDALFVDDIYSLFPDGLDAQSRLAKIDEVRAGQGDDIIDLTSQRFEYIGDGMTVRGGLGDDVIWANHGDNWLFGDAGNDRIVGAGGNDVLVGGAGNDALHGGGGNDIFAFGGDWGQDTVEQLESGKVTLWFADGDGSKWNAATRTYTDGLNSVKVIGECTDISLKFGAGDDAARFAELGAKSAFDEFTSEKIFEEKNKGLLA